jgi:cytochrome c biogenesis protein CcdA
LSKVFYKPLLMIFCIFLFMVFLVGSDAKLTYAETDSSDSILKDQVLYYFWAFCPLCTEPDENLVRFQKHPIPIEIYEVVYNAENLEKFNLVREELGIDMVIFPIFIYNGQYWIGDSDALLTEVEKSIERSFDENLPDESQTVINLPFMGEIDLLSSPVMLSTMVIAFLDGFNPCSFFVLTFLLAIIVHSASRKRIFLVGLTFLIATSLVYGLFMLGALNVMLIASQLFWIRNLVAAIVIILGVFGIKDYFAYKEGLSMSIPDSYKTKYYRQVRKIFYSKSIVPMITATAVMAMGIALVELPCTAGFPFIWTGIITRLNLSTSEYAFLFALYLFIYFADEFIIFLLALLKMRTVKITEESGRFLKLVAGSLMVILGLVLVVEPTLMESLPGMGLAFGSSLVLILLMYAIRKLLLTRMRQT